MKVNKAQAIMYIFHMLLVNGKVNKDEIQSVISISDITFRRYIQEIRAYLVNFNLSKEIVYKKDVDYYVIKSM